MKLSEEIKEKITEDWARLLPGLGIYKPMRLLRRVGPLLSGICLNRDSGNDAYDPIFHVHCLAKPFPGVSLTLSEHLLTERTHAPVTIRAVFHENRYAEACARLQKQAPLPLSGPLSCDQVVRAYRQHMQTPFGKLYSQVLYEDIIAILVWCDRLAEAKASLKEFVNHLRSWPACVVAKVPRGVESLVEPCRRWIEDPTALKATVEREVVKLEPIIYLSRTSYAKISSFA